MGSLEDRPSESGTGEEWFVSVGTSSSRLESDTQSVDGPELLGG